MTPKPEENPSIPAQYLTPEEVSELVKLSRVFVYKLIRERQIPSIKIGRVVRIRKDRLEEWLRSKEN